MIRFYPGEQFREVEIGHALYRYAISNRGRLMTFKNSIEEDGKLLNGGNSSGYRTFRYNIRINGRMVGKTLFIYRLVAELFIPKESEDMNYVIHLDHVKDNDNVSNLQWVTYEGKLQHRRKNPKVMNLGAKVRESKLKADGRKMTSTNVIHLKKLLKDPERKTRLKMLAKQFGISEMQVSRIKNGQNWGHIKV